MQSEVVSLTVEVELEPGEKLVLPEAVVAAISAGRWRITFQPLLATAGAAPVRDHSAFLNSYAPEDEGLYDDDASR
jgi:hypothetical protein